MSPSARRVARRARGRAACCSERDIPRLMDDIHPANPICRLAAHTPKISQARALSHDRARCGSVIFVQRFGSSLNLNPLLHRLVRELRLPPDRHADYLVGETVYRRLADVPMEAVVEAETPSGERLRLEPEPVGGQYLWKNSPRRRGWHLAIARCGRRGRCVRRQLRRPRIRTRTRSARVRTERFRGRRSPFPQPKRRPAPRSLGQSPRPRVVARIPAFGPRPPPRRTVDRPRAPRRSGSSGGIKTYRRGLFRFAQASGLTRIGLNSTINLTPRRRAIRRWWNVRERCKMITASLPSTCP